MKKSRGLRLFFLWPAEEAICATHASRLKIPSKKSWIISG